MSNKYLCSARKKKEDEFYTCYCDIKDELQHYTKYFKDKIVYCNCDDPYKSNFVKYFIENFNSLKLKKLICTCYSPLSKYKPLFSYDSLDNELYKQKAYKAEINEVNKENNIDDLIKNKNNKLSLLRSDGDFRSDECIELLKEADIVVTNPPFSLFREYITQLIEYDKKFLIIGNINAITYKDIFPLIMNNKIWLGYNYGYMAFTVPNSYEPHDTRYWEDENGQKWRSLGNIYWYTNLPVKEKNEKLELTKSYYENKNDYLKYDNYDAINVNYVNDIPYDYDGVMGVPVTFLQHYNPGQFELIGEAVHGSDNKYDLFKPMMNGIYTYKHLLIKNKNVVDMKGK